MNGIYIICHMATALDGKITGPFMESEAAGIVNGEYERINKAYNPDAWLCGRVTTDENFTFYRKPVLNDNTVLVPEGDYVAVNDASMYYVSVDTSGRLGWENNTLHYADRPAAHIIEVLSEHVDKAYRAFLRERKISYIIAGEKQLDCALAVKKLKQLFNINTLVLSGGGFINWSFLQADLIDELSIVLMPVADGENNTVTLFEKSDFLPEKSAVEFSLKDVEKTAGDGVWLRYSVKNKNEQAKIAISKKAEQYHEKLFPDYKSEFLETDPEFIEYFDNFAFDEVINNDNTDDRTRMIAILSALLGCQGIDEFKIMLSSALNVGVSPVEIKETVYQAVAYLGIGRVFPFLRVVNDFFISKGIQLPLPGQATTTENRLEKGIQAQVDIFGEVMSDFYKSGPEESRHINRWLAENCFGDYYTRTGLSYQQREMITFCFLAAQGGCESQLTSHAAANMHIGNDKKFLIQIISQCLPFIGYPRSLNALRCVNEAVENSKK